MSSRKNKKLRDKRYAHVYARELQDLLIAAQIRTLRLQRQLNQDQLAGLANMKQARISLLESGGYSNWSISTLRSLAEAFDVGLEVRFVDYFNLVNEMERQDVRALRVDSRKDTISEPSIDVLFSAVSVAQAKPVSDVAPVQSEIEKYYYQANIAPHAVQ